MGFQLLNEVAAMTDGKPRERADPVDLADAHRAQRQDGDAIVKVPPVVASRCMLPTSFCTVLHRYD